ncbi:MAG: hypothetical protein CM1200mP10_30710 [Candidatus Neomarinimicrobiota bacterium]|nr:MAG: hypothetical protein CM1200mP10_30710 [Candidatus Neomarinimicrobiota bacterium]
MAPLCVIWKQAETAAEYVKKGQMVYVEGRLQTRSWEDKDGVKRYSTEIVGNSFTMLGRRSADESGSILSRTMKIYRFN